MTHLKQAQEWLSKTFPDTGGDRYVVQEVLAFARYLDEQEKLKNEGRVCQITGIRYNDPTICIKGNGHFACSCKNCSAEYAHLSHTHCYLKENPPCGLKGNHCCLCDIVSGEKPTQVPEELKWQEPAVATFSMNQIEENTRCISENIATIGKLLARSLQPRNQ